MTQEIDIVALQEQAEANVRAEYQEAYARVEQQMQDVRTKEAKWAKIHHRLNTLTTIKSSTDAHPSLDDVLNTLDEQLLEFQKLKKVMDLIQTNELLQSQWDRLTASIRLVGGDKND
jgi:hypothetical protein